MLIIVGCSLFGLLIGFIFGAHYGIDCCSDDIENTTILRHIKDYIIDKESLDKDETSILRHQLMSIKI